MGYRSDSIVVSRDMGPLRVFSTYFRSAKTDLVWFKWGFGEGLLKDNFALFEAYTTPIPKRRKLLVKRLIL